MHENANNDLCRLKLYKYPWDNMQGYGYVKLREIDWWKEINWFKNRF